MNQGNTARSAKVQFLKMFFWIPFIAVIAVIFPISRSRFIRVPDVGTGGIIRFKLQRCCNGVTL